MYFATAAFVGLVAFASTAALAAPLSAAASSIGANDNFSPLRVIPRDTIKALYARGTGAALCVFKL